MIHKHFISIADSHCSTPVTQCTHYLLYFVRSSDNTLHDDILLLTLKPVYLLCIYRNLYEHY